MLKTESDKHFFYVFQDYLSRFGYLAPLDPRLGRMRSAKELKEAVKSFQRFAGLKETGDLTDPKTIEMIQTSRCGLNDFGPTDKTRRKRRYALQGTQWKKNVMECFILFL